MDYSFALCANVLNSGSVLNLTAKGFSMWPVIVQGMKAQISPLGPSFPQKGSLLLVNLDGRLVVHRCWGVTDKEGILMVITKGDANIGFDAPITIDMILGKVTLLWDDSAGSRDPNRGFLRIYGQVLCASKFLAGVWARICRIVLRIIEVF